MSLPYLGTVYPELADPDAEMQKAQQLIDKNGKNSTEIDSTINSSAINQNS